MESEELKSKRDNSKKRIDKNKEFKRKRAKLKPTPKQKYKKYSFPEEEF